MSCRPPSTPALPTTQLAGRPWNKSWEIECVGAPISRKASLHSARREVPNMTEEIDIAGLIKAGGRVAWSAGPVEPTQLLRTLDKQLDRVPRASTLINLSLENTIDAKRLASRMHVVALGGAGTNRRFQEIGALDVLP